jgi:methionyl-tRNA synthetase
MKYFITTPIYYVNDAPHIGHLYTTLAGDILVRYHKLIGDDVYLLTGTDEHGAKIAEVAEKKGIEPKEFADQISAQFKSLWAKYDVKFDRFIRTTDADHEITVAEFLTKLKEKDFIYKGEYKGLYCRGCESYKKQSELVDGKCPDHNRVPEELSEPAYFFKLSQFKSQLIELIKCNALLIQPEIRKNEVLSFLQGQELEDVAISRQNVAWGIPLPWDNKHTIYVWVDALINYYTAAKEKNLWPADLHLMAKDILRFHCVIWPAMLIAIGEKPPKSVFVHGYFTIDGQKMSKSLGNVVDPDKLLEQYPRDVIRVFLFKAFPFGSDGDFSFDLLKEFYNGQLANELGNLVQRVLTMVKNYQNGVITKPKDIDPTFEIDKVSETWSLWKSSLDNLQFELGLKAIWALIKYANQYIDDNKPWGLAKSDSEKLAIVLYNLTEVIRHLSILLLPYMPDTASEISNRLGIKLQEDLLVDKQNWGVLKDGTKIELSEALFPRRG